MCRSSFRAGRVFSADGQGETIPEIYEQRLQILKRALYAGCRRCHRQDQTYVWLRVVRPCACCLSLKITGFFCPQTLICTTTLSRVDRPPWLVIPPSVGWVVLDAHYTL